MLGAVGSAEGRPLSREAARDESTYFTLPVMMLPSFAFGSTSSHSVSLSLLLKSLFPAMLDNTCGHTHGRDKNY